MFVIKIGIKTEYFYHPIYINGEKDPFNRR